jgi:hypothetical protein
MHASLSMSAGKDQVLRFHDETTLPATSEPLTDAAERIHGATALSGNSSLGARPGGLKGH